jgi:hypothetical protein
MAGHASQMVKGKLLFLSMQIKLILGDCAESLLSLRHCNFERNLRNFKKKFTLKEQFSQKVFFCKNTFSK